MRERSLESLVDMAACARAEDHLVYVVCYGSELAEAHPEHAARICRTVGSAARMRRIELDDLLAAWTAVVRQDALAESPL